MIVYRVENADGRGPYVGNPVPEMDDAANDRQPMAWQDGLSEWWNDGKANAYRYGFRTLEQIKSWFLPDQLTILARHGFRVTEYEVPQSHVLSGKKQVVFNPEQAKPLAFKQLEELK